MRLTSSKPGSRERKPLHAEVRSVVELIERVVPSFHRDTIPATPTQEGTDEIEMTHDQELTYEQIGESIYIRMKHLEAEIVCLKTAYVMAQNVEVEMVEIKNKAESRKQTISTLNKKLTEANVEIDKLRRELACRPCPRQARVRAGTR